MCASSRLIGLENAMTTTSIAAGSAKCLEQYIGLSFSEKDARLESNVINSFDKILRCADVQIVVVRE